MMRIEVTETPFPDAEMDHIVAVYKLAIHRAFDGRVVDPRALVGSLLEGALGVLKEAGINAPKTFAHTILDGLDIEHIPPFSQVAPNCQPQH